MLKWANEASPGVLILSTELHLIKGLFTTPKLESIHWYLNMCSSADPQNEGPRVSGLCPLVCKQGLQKREKTIENRKKSSNAEHGQHSYRYIVLCELKISLGAALLDQSHPNYPIFTSE